MNNNKLKIIIETKTLNHALAFANSVVEKRNVIAELSNIKLSAKNNMLELVATDMDLYLSQKIGVQILSEGEITVSIKILTDIIKKIYDTEITLSVLNENDKLEILGKQCNFKLETIPASQFPMISDIKAESILEVSCRDFAKIIDYTHFSISTEETRYNLNGIYLHIKGKEFCAASTDGHRFSLSSIILNDQMIRDKNKEFGVILPRKTVDEVLKIVKDSKNIQTNIEIWLDINRIKLICNNIVIISKLIDGTFPDYETFIPDIPTQNNYKLVINTKILAESIDRVSTITIDKFRAVKLTLSKGAIEITASGESIGVAKEVISCCKEQGNLCEYDYDHVLSIGFNPKYLMDILNTIKSDQVELYFCDSYTPTLIKIPENYQDIFVVMPVKV